LALRFGLGFDFLIEQNPRNYFGGFAIEKHRKEREQNHLEFWCPAGIQIWTNGILEKLRA